MVARSKARLAKAEKLTSGEAATRRARGCATFLGPLNENQAHFGAVRCRFVRGSVWRGSAPAGREGGREARGLFERADRIVDKSVARHRERGAARTGRQEYAPHTLHE